MITYFHRNKKAGFSIDKVTQTVISLISSKQEYYLPYYGGRFSVILKNILFTFIHRNKTGINHITGDVHYCSLGLLGCKSILTVHDLVWLDFHKLSRLKRMIFTILYVKLPLLLSTKVVAISNATKNTLLKYSNRDDIVVIHNAIDPIFFSVPRNTDIVPRHFLLIGTNPNKNMERTFLSLKGIDCTLTIIGKLSENYLSLLKECDIKYIHKTNLSDTEIFKEYINCDLVLFMSLYEGFGMPIIEANKVGRPVITSDLPVLREIGGDSCIFIDPLNIKDMHNGINRLVIDANLRKICVERGFENVKRFDVNIIKSRWDQLYNSI